MVVQDDAEQLPGASTGACTGSEAWTSTHGADQSAGASSSGSLAASSAGTGAPDSTAPEEKPLLEAVALAEPMQAEPSQKEPMQAEPNQLEGRHAEPNQEAQPSQAQASQVVEPKAKAAPRAAGIRINRSPAEILEQISPPGMILRLTFNDWRFKVDTLGEVRDMAAGSDPPYDKKSFSRTFAGRTLAWQACLREVHKHAWERLGYLVSKGKLPAPSQSSVPGVVPQHILDALDPHVAALPPPTTYS